MANDAICRLIGSHLSCQVKGFRRRTNNATIIDKQVLTDKSKTPEEYTSWSAIVSEDLFEIQSQSSIADVCMMEAWISSRKRSHGVLSVGCVGVPQTTNKRSTNLLQWLSLDWTVRWSTSELDYSNLMRWLSKIRHNLPWIWPPSPDLQSWSWS